MKKNRISIAIVKNVQEEFLISLRPKGVHLEGKWEFPGGKVEKNELPEQAMCRELFEEVGLIAVDYQLLEEKSFAYDDVSLHLYFYLVTQFSGKVQGREGQQIKWVSKAQLAEYEFPEANITVIKLL